MKYRQIYKVYIAKRAVVETEIIKKNKLHLQDKISLDKMTIPRNLKSLEIRHSNLNL